MSTRERTTYFISGNSKSSSSEVIANQELRGCTVSVYGQYTIMVYGDLSIFDKNVLEKHFELYDDIFDESVLTLIKE